METNPPIIPLIRTTQRSIFNRNLVRSLNLIKNIRLDGKDRKFHRKAHGSISPSIFFPLPFLFFLHHFERVKDRFNILAIVFSFFLQNHRNDENLVRLGKSVDPPMVYLHPFSVLGCKTLDFGLGLPCTAKILIIFSLLSAKNLYPPPSPAV